MQKTNQVEIIKQLTSLDQLTPDELATLLTFLISNERAPSGPYLLSKDIEENQALNAKVYQLFADKNKILKGTYMYAQSSVSELSPPTPNKSSVSHPKELPKVRAIHESVLKQSSQILTPELYEYILPTLNKLFKRDNHGEITQLTSDFIDSYTGLLSDKPSNERLSLLGEANFYTWVAYSLYDSLLDDAKGSPLNIPAANIFHRLALSTYLRAGLSFDRLDSILGSVDQANANEVSHSRLPVKNGSITIVNIPTEKSLHKLLAARSSVHYIGVLEIIRTLTQNTIHYQKSKSILSAYCAARQLSDDIHDWQEDLSNGHISYVVAHLLKAANIKDGVYTLQPLITKLRHVFWEKELDVLVNDCLKICQDAQYSYQEYLHLKPGSSFESITLKPIIDACVSAKNNIHFSKNFLQEIKG